MANDEHVAMLKKGVTAWNAWRDKNESVVPDLSEANLSGAILIGADLNSADLSGADLSGADLNSAHLWHANLSGTNLRGAGLGSTDLTVANLSGANLSGIRLFSTILRETNLSGADLSYVTFIETFFVNVDLTNVIGLDTSEHLGPSSIDFRTLQKSPNLPLAFLRGVGLPDRLIDNLPSLLNQAIEFYSCFISYSSKDQGFAERLHDAEPWCALLVRSSRHAHWRKDHRRSRRGDPAARQGPADPLRGCHRE
jgi:Pentapeptide repeats (8 copies)